MKLPNLLLVGAMKGGSTSLYDDLSNIAEIFMSVEKEPHSLQDKSILSERGLDEYSSLFKNSSSEIWRGEGSTGYTKMPASKGTAKIAKQVLGSKIKIIYIIREPVSRAISHHQYMYTRYKTGSVDFNEDVLYRNELVDYSKYFYQISPWIKEFGSENIKIITLERYSENKNECLSEICQFLGLDYKISKNAAERKNVTSSMRIIPPVIQKFTDTRIYIKILRPTIIKSLGGRSLSFIRNKLRKYNAIEFPRVNSKTHQIVWEKVKDDVNELKYIVNSRDLVYINKWMSH
ncbi:hypothetical protein CXF72_06295 [Psychromonas sp. MB-3u-54]|uniref:sulfotransferase domain-containing protein n=1 Tax=Psychromonas sp. MB-3u-54 TaxID=2058319 RepID=UPI000C33A7AF|nr:sulfotransferase domain-containing protein [Psychromonas sp. MB-3u-54]PKH03416.1 hypothetical protein CXF72_06295 [Psychromonas sp. MB-3u-54]